MDAPSAIKLQLWEDGSETHQIGKSIYTIVWDRGRLPRKVRPTCKSRTPYHACMIRGLHLDQVVLCPAFCGPTDNLV
jgi:hypothetical protein